MQILCIGNNTEHTDFLAREIASQYNLPCYGLLSEDTTTDFSRTGVYHSSVLDLRRGALVEIGQKFDKVIILNQTSDSYGHPNAFYITASVGQELSGLTTVEWQNPDMNQTISFFEKLVKENQSFCIFPFIELLTNNDHTTVCCRSLRPITKVSELGDYNTNPEYQKIRQNMINGTMMPEHCNSCYKQEQLGMISARQQETVEWANRLQLKSLDDLQAITHPVYYEVRPSNVCNLQCRMCYPDNSELINKEYVKIGLASKLKKIAYSGFEIVDLDHVKKLYVAGGEPTAMPEFYNFLDSCIHSGRTFEFTVNTNAVKFSDKFKQQLAKLPHMQFIVSIDGFDRLNDYIRWPSNWSQIIDNVKYLRQHGHVVHFNTTVSMYNVYDLHSLLRFFDQEFLGTRVHCQSAEGLTTPFNFPNANLVVNDFQKIKSLCCYQDDPLLASFVDSIISYFNNRTTVDRQAVLKFKKFNQTLDQSRGSNIEDYAPILSQELKQYHD